MQIEKGSEGCGDSGKSSILDSIDLCLGARRNIQFTDSDFHKVDVTSPILIRITVVELDDGLKNLDAYGLYLRGFVDFLEQFKAHPARDRALFEKDGLIF